MWRLTFVTHIFIIICVLYCSSLRVDKNDDTYGQNARYHGRHPPFRGHQIRKPKQNPPKRRQMGFDYYNSKNEDGNSSYEYYTSEEDSLEDITIRTTIAGQKPETSTMPEPPPPPEYDQNTFDLSIPDSSKAGLTEEAWSSLLDQKEALKEQEKNINTIVQKWTNRENYELDNHIRHYGSERMIIKSCYQIAATYLNADQDLRDYYKIRFLYKREMVYEIGYIVHEIVYKYTIVLELYHTVQARFFNVSQFHNLAPATMMLQFYVNILHQCQQIMHLCNTLSEIEEKYKDVPDQEAFEEGSDFDHHSSEEQMSEEDKKEMARFQKQKIERVKKNKRQRKKAVHSGRITTTTRTKRPRTNSRFQIEYGWSIEDW